VKRRFPADKAPLKEKARIRKVANGIITTVAGNGQAGFSGDGGPATSATMSYPTGVAADSSGAIYFAADVNNLRIRRVSGGVITTVAGDGYGGYSGDGLQATHASINPWGIAVDAAQNLYIGDYNNNRIRSKRCHTSETGSGRLRGVRLMPGIWSPPRFRRGSRTSPRWLSARPPYTAALSSLQRLERLRWLISVYGTNLASGSVGASGLPLPLSSNGTQVFLGAQPLPILYTSSGQMNVQVPYSAPVDTTFQLCVQNGSTLSVPQTLTVAQASPGIFTTNEQGFGQGAIVKSDGVTLAQPGTPAAIGEAIVIYCTGLGATTPAVTEGQPAPSTPLLAATSNPTTVMIGGQPAQLLFSGLTPGFAGLYQVNAVVPSGIATGDAVPVTVTVAGQTSQTGVTMSVH
jgi:uncharacterized protein (TIGR03437 family)